MVGLLLERMCGLIGCDCSITKSAKFAFEKALYSAHKIRPPYTPPAELLRGDKDLPSSFVFSADLIWSPWQIVSQADYPSRVLTLAKF